MIEMICCLDKTLSWTPGAHDKQHIINEMMCPNNTSFTMNEMMGEYMNTGYSALMKRGRELESNAWTRN